MTNLSHKKNWHEEKAILKDQKGQMLLSYVISDRAFDGGQYLLAINILDTVVLKAKKIVSCTDTSLIQISFPLGKDVPVDFLENHEITGNLKIISFSKNKVTVKLNIIVHGLKSGAIYSYKGKKTFIDYSPWN